MKPHTRRKIERLPIIAGIAVSAALILGNCGPKPASQAADGADDEANGPRIVLKDSPRSSSLAGPVENAPPNTRPTPEVASEVAPETVPETAGPTATVPVAVRAVAVPAGRDVEAYWQSDSFDLGMAMLLLAAAHRPAIDVPTAAAQLDAVARAIADEIGPRAEPEFLRERIAFELFVKCGLQFLREDTEATRTDADLLAFPAVFENRRGNCVSLVTLILALADRLGVGEFFHAATGPRHLYVQISLPGLEDTVLETAQPFETWTDADEMRALGLEWPLPTTSPFARALSRLETFSVVLNNFSLVLAAADRHAEALKWLDRAIEFYPANVHARVNRAAERMIVAAQMPTESQSRADALRQVMTDLELARRLFPEYGEVYLHYARAYRMIGDAHAAVKILADGAEFVPAEKRFEAHREKIMALLDTSDAQAALAAVRDAEPFCPADDPQAQADLAYARGLALVYLKRFADAKPELERALAGVSAAQRARLLMVVLDTAEMAGELAFAEVFLRRFVTAFRDQAVEGVDAQTLAQWLRRHATRQIAAARRAAGDGASGTSSDSDAGFRAAEWALLQAIALADDFPGRMTLGTLYWNLRDPRAALPHLQRALQVAPAERERFDALDLLAHVYLHGPTANRESARRTINEIHALNDATLRREAWVFEARLVAFGKERVTRADAEKMVEFLDRYVAENGTDATALAQRDELRRALNR